MNKELYNKLFSRMDELGAIRKDLSFGCEVKAEGNLYKINPEKVKELENIFGHCMSKKQAEEWKRDAEENDRFTNMLYEIKKSELVCYETEVYIGTITQYYGNFSDFSVIADGKSNHGISQSEGLFFLGPKDIGEHFEDIRFFGRSNKKEIIGHSPILTDVLRARNTHPDMWKYNPLLCDGLKICFGWDYSKPFLKDQSDELGEELIKLLTHD